MLADDRYRAAVDGRQDGLVNSDDSLEVAVEELPDAPSQTDIDRVVMSLLQDVRESVAPSALEEVLRGRSAADRRRLIGAYVNGWETGFRERLHGALARVRRDLAEETSLEMLRGRR